MEDIQRREVGDNKAVMGEKDYSARQTSNPGKKDPHGAKQIDRRKPFNSERKVFRTVYAAKGAPASLVIGLRGLKRTWIFLKENQTIKLREKSHHWGFPGRDGEYCLGQRT